MVDPDDLARRADEVMEDGGRVARSGADVKDFRAWPEEWQQIGRC